MENKVLLDSYHSADVNYTRMLNHKSAASLGHGHFSKGGEAAIRKSHQVIYPEQPQASYFSPEVRRGAQQVQKQS